MEYENANFEGFRLISVDKDGNAHLTQSASDFIVKCTDTVNAIKADLEKMKALLMKHLSAHELTKISDGLVTVTLIAESVKNILDTEKFKTEHPAMYAEYCKESKSKAYVKIDVKHSKS